MALKGATSEVPVVERVKAAQKALSQAANTLNAASDSLSKAIASLDSTLQKHNLGLTVWVRLSGSDYGDDWWRRDLGYAKFKDGWGVALRTAEGDSNLPECDSEQVWPFNEAPRWLRVEAVGKIPELLEKLAAEAEDTAKKIEKKTEQVSEFVTAMGEAVAGPGEPSSPKPTVKPVTGLIAPANRGTTIGQLMDPRASESISKAITQALADRAKSK